MTSPNDKVIIDIIIIAIKSVKSAALKMFGLKPCVFYK